MTTHTFLAVLASAAVSQAAVVMDLTYSTASSTVVTGILTLDDSVLGSELNFQEISSLPSFLIAAEITVAGASSGNGTFSVANGDFEGMVLQSAGTLPATAEAVTLSSFNDINFFSTNAGTPNGFFVFELELGDGSSATLTSIESVPEPSALGLLALCGVASMTRRRRS